MGSLPYEVLDGETRDDYIKRVKEELLYEDIQLCDSAGPSTRNYEQEAEDLYDQQFNAFWEPSVNFQ